EVTPSVSPDPRRASPRRPPSLDPDPTARQLEILCTALQPPSRFRHGQIDAAEERPLFDVCRGQRFVSSGALLQIIQRALDTWPIQLTGFDTRVQLDRLERIVERTRVARPGV